MIIMQFPTCRGVINPPHIFKNENHFWPLTGDYLPQYWYKVSFFPSTTFLVVSISLTNFSLTRSSHMYESCICLLLILACRLCWFFYTIVVLESTNLHGDILLLLPLLFGIYQPPLFWSSSILWVFSSTMGWIATSSMCVVIANGFSLIT